MQKPPPRWLVRDGSWAQHSQEDRNIPSPPAPRFAPHLGTSTGIEVCRFIHSFGRPPLSARPWAVPQGLGVFGTVPIQFRRRYPGRTLATEVRMNGGRLPSPSLGRQGGFLAEGMAQAKNTQVLSEQTRFSTGSLPG